MEKNYYQINKEKEARKLEDLANVKPIKKEYVLINDDEIVTEKCDLEESIYWLLKEDINAEIKVYQTTENSLYLDAMSVVETFYENDLITEDAEVPEEKIKELQNFLDKWCIETQEVSRMTYEVHHEKEIDITEIVEKIKKELIEDQNK